MSSALSVFRQAKNGFAGSAEEIARFADQDVFIGNVHPTGVPTITGTENVLTADRTGILDQNGLPNAAGFHYQWQSSADGLTAWSNATGTSTNVSYTVPTSGPGSADFYRVVVSYTDQAGFSESVTSLMTAKVGSDTASDNFSGTADPNLLNGRGGADTISGLDGDDVINGGAGADRLSGGLGNDTILAGAGADIVNGGLGNDILNGNAGADVAVFTGTVSGNVYAINGGELTVTGPDGIDTLSNVEQLQFGADTFTLLQGTNGNNTLVGSNDADLVVGGGGADTINTGTSNDYVDAGLGNDTIRWNVGDGHDIVYGGLGGTDTFIVNGNGTAETFHVYARADAIAAGITGLAANTDIVITRNGTSTASVIAELDEIEEIIINTGAGADTVMAIGNFDPTNLNFNTITINDGGGRTTVDVTQLTSAHHVAFHTKGKDDTIIGARPQDEVISDGGTTAGTGTGNGNISGNGSSSSGGDSTPGHSKPSSGSLSTYDDQLRAHAGATSPPPPAIHDDRHDHKASRPVSAIDHERHSEDGGCHLNSSPASGVTSVEPVRAADPVPVSSAASLLAGSPVSQADAPPAAGITSHDTFVFKTHQFASSGASFEAGDTIDLKPLFAALQLGDHDGVFQAAQAMFNAAGHIKGHEGSSTTHEVQDHSNDNDHSAAIVVHKVVIGTDWL